MKPMIQKSDYPNKQLLDSLLRDFGIKPSEEMRDKLRLEVESQKEKFVAVERVHGKNQGRDLSR
jgi:hypothetical protein